MTFRGDDDFLSGTALLKLALVFGAVALVGVAVVYGLKRYLPGVYSFAPGNGSRRIQVLETRRLTPRTTVFLLEVDNHLLLVGQAGESVTTLYSWGKSMDGIAPDAEPPR